MLRKKLEKAAESKDVSTQRDVLAQLKSATFKLTAIAQSKLSKAVQRLSKSEDAKL